MGCTIVEPHHSAPSPVLDGAQNGVGAPGAEEVDSDSEPPGLEASSESEDEHLDGWEEDMSVGDDFAMGLGWWKDVPWDTILALECNTSSFVPDGVEHAVATLKGEMGDYIRSRERAGDVEAEELGWKALLAVDALLFFDLKGGESISRKALVADRTRFCEQGHWGTLWAHAENADHAKEPR